MSQTDQSYCLYMDGNAWCATAPGHIDLQASPAGFGATQVEACEDLYRQLDMQPPVLDDFMVQCTRCGEWISHGCEPDGCKDFDCPGLSLFEG